MRRLLQRFGLPVLVVVLALTAAFAALPAAAAGSNPLKAAAAKVVKPAAKTQTAKAQAEAPKTWTVLVGGETKGATSGWEFMKFYPGTIQVNVGDTIIFKLNSFEPHTVTFPKTGTKLPQFIIPESAGSKTMILNPLLAFPQGGSSYDGLALTGSGQLGGAPGLPTEYKLTFTKAGSFEYYCAFHPMMTGRVIVRKAGTKYPETQAQLDSAAQKALQADDAAVAKLAKAKNLDKIVTRAGAKKGTMVHTVLAGWGNGVYSWMRFSPANINIKPGDTVEWVQADIETPHTVTFVSGGKTPEFILQEKDANGKPMLVLNPEVVAPAGGKVYEGTGYFNSGLLMGTKAGQPGPRTYMLEFTKAGKYDYVCLIHDEMGMKGAVTVAAAQARAHTQVIRHTLNTHKAAPKPVKP